MRKELISSRVVVVVVASGVGARCRGGLYRIKANSPKKKRWPYVALCARCVSGVGAGYDAEWRYVALGGCFPPVRI